MEKILEKGPPAPKMPKPHRCDLTPPSMLDNFTPKTIDYAKVARAY